MRFLLTNDDGVNADGLRALIDKVLSLNGHTALVVAPDRERSACGHGISIHHPIEVRPIPSGDPRVEIYAASGTPADCVKLAVGGLSESPPDFVISGVNRGPNLGNDVFYSGTVSAAMEAVMLGFRAMAVSVAAFENLDYATAADFAVEQAILANAGGDWPPLVNVNVPAVTGDSIAGVAVTRLGVRVYRDAFQRRTDPKGREWFWLSGELVADETIDDTDGCAIRRNLISVTPLLYNLTDVSGIDILGKRDFTLPGVARIPKTGG